MPSNKPKPTKLTIRSYQVGFGDCFLLMFHYPPVNGTPQMRCVLVDCGSMGKPKSAPGLKDVAKQIVADCGGQLTAVIATHRHADHINGFATNEKKNAPGDVLRTLAPKLVLQPWTEDPNVAPTAKAPTATGGSGPHAFGPRQFVAGLHRMHEFAELILEEVRRLDSRLPAATREQLNFLGEENIANLSAVKNLMTMRAPGGKNEYLHYGKKTELSKLLPGVKIRVLGPPTPQQYPAVEKQRAEDAAEFWHILGAAARRLTAAGGFSPFDRRFAVGSGRAVGKGPAHARWIIRRIQAAHIEQRLEIVRALDDAMNNTSLILLFEAGGKKFLFPGDAQIENWNYALKDAPQAAANCVLLEGTDFYKVGHHGSLNATPKTLWALFKKRNKQTVAGRLRTAVSTMAGKHGTLSRQTEVPRRTLVTALGEESDFFSTQSLKTKTRTSEDIEFDL